jgi:hypothetical protein
MCRISSGNDRHDRFQMRLKCLDHLWVVSTMSSTTACRVPSISFSLFLLHLPMTLLTLWSQSRQHPRCPKPGYSLFNIKFPVSGFPFYTCLGSTQAYQTLLYTDIRDHVDSIYALHDVVTGICSVHLFWWAHFFLPPYSNIFSSPFIIGSFLLAETMINDPI